MSLISTDWFVGLTIAFEYVATVEQLYFLELRLGTSPRWDESEKTGTSDECGGKKNGGKGDNKRSASKLMLFVCYLTDVNCLSVEIFDQYLTKLVFN